MRMSESAGVLEMISSEPIILPVGKLRLHKQTVSQVPWDLRQYLLVPG